MTYQNQMNICLASDNNYAKLAGVSISSFLKSAESNDYFNFFILDNNISNKRKKEILELKKLKPCNIEFIKVDNKKFEGLYLPPQKGYLSISSYHRFLIPSLFKNLDKILYIDCDIIATTSISEFYNTDLTNYSAAVIRDTSCETQQKKFGFNPNEIYFNSGVILFNLQKCFSENLEKKLFDTIKNGLDDQDILNICLKGNVKEMPITWNWQGKAKHYSQEKPPKLIHFITAYKPWLTGSKHSFNKEYFKALKNTPWDSFYDQNLRRFLPILHKDKRFIHFCLWGIKTRIKYKKI